MIRNLLSVGGFTLLSRVTGFLSLAMQSAIMGAGAVSDAFFIAQRLPNSFRAIFGEGAFNAAFVPSYSMAIEQKGDAAAEEFAGEVGDRDRVGGDVDQLVLAELDGEAGELDERGHIRGDEVLPVPHTHDQR